MIILVCGGRDYQDRARVFHELNELERCRGNILGLIHGAARGADSLAAEWQALRIRADIAFCTENRRRDPGRVLGLRRWSSLWMAGYPAQWASLGRSAGPIRNQSMLDQHPGIMVGVAFPGGPGTADMMAKMRQRGIEVIEIKD